MQFQHLYQCKHYSNTYLLSVPPHLILIPTQLSFHSLLQHPAVDLTLLSNVPFEQVTHILITDFRDLYLIPYLLNHPHLNAVILMPILLYQLFLPLYNDFYEQMQHGYHQDVPHKQIKLGDLDYLSFNENDLEIPEIQKEKLHLLQPIAYQEQKVVNGLTVKALGDGRGQGGVWQIERLGIVLSMGNGVGRIDQWTNMDSIIIGDSWKPEGEQFNTPSWQNVVLDKIKEHQSEVNFLMPVKDFTQFLDWTCGPQEVFQKAKFLVVGPHFEQMFKIAEAYLECLDPSLANNIYKPQPQLPFSHLKKLMNERIITHFNTIYDVLEHNQSRSFESLVKLNSPCVYVTLDCTLRYGSGQKFVQLLEQSQGKYLLLTEKDLQTPELFKPFKEISTANVVYCPYDNRYTWKQMMDHAKPNTFKQMLVPESKGKPDLQTESYKLLEKKIIKSVGTGKKFKVNKFIKGQWYQMETIKYMYGEMEFEQGHVNFNPHKPQIAGQGLILERDRNKNVEILELQILNYFNKKQITVTEHRREMPYLQYYSGETLLAVLKLEEHTTTIYGNQYQHDLLQIFRKVFNYLS